MLIKVEEKERAHLQYTLSRGTRIYFSSWT
jgi:hypothetical protein